MKEEKKTDMAVAEDVSIKGLDIKEKLLRIQNELKVNKDNFNEHGNFSYRNCEDIMEKVKPLCLKYRCLVLMQDDIKLIGDRFYIRAQVDLHDLESGNIISVAALARETESRKGFDESQLTGSSSSYARKYALGGMFAIDDGKDADTLDNTKQGVASLKKKDKQEDVSDEEAKADKERKEQLQKVQGVMRAILQNPKATNEQVANNQQEVLSLFSKHQVDLKGLSLASAETLVLIEKDLVELHKKIFGE